MQISINTFLYLLRKDILHNGEKLAVCDIAYQLGTFFKKQQQFMKEKFFEQVIRLRIPIIVLFIIVALAGAVGRQKVSVNYDMNDYLPPESLSTVSLDKMHEEFTGEIPNARVAIKDVSYAKALSYKEKLEQIKGVGEVTWLDDQNPMDMPLSMLDTETVEEYYKDKTALYTITVKEEDINDTVPRIRKLIGEDNAMTGSAVSTAIATTSTVSEIQKITAFSLIIVFLVLPGMLYVTDRQKNKI